jgi:hypothetical protein
VKTGNPARLPLAGFVITSRKGTDDPVKSVATPTHERRVSCRYLRRSGEQCTAECLDPEGDILICAKHAARTVVLIKHRATEAKKRLGPVAVGELVPGVVADLPTDPR